MASRLFNLLFAHTSMRALSLEQRCSSTRLQLNQYRCYKKFSRIPRRVNPAVGDEQKMRMEQYVEETKSEVNPEVLDEINKLKSQHLYSDIGSQTTKISTKKKNQSEDKEKFSSTETNDDNLSEVIEADGVHEYEQEETENILKKINVKLFNKGPSMYRSLLKHCHSAKSRRDNDLLVLDTPPLIQEAIAAGLTPTAIYFSRVSSLVKMMPRDMKAKDSIEMLKTYPLLRTPYKKISLYTSLTSSPGILGLFSLSQAEAVHNTRQLTSLKASSPPVTLVLDEVRQPGNIGAIIRTAAAAGVSKIVLIKGCCDPWESKALRAASGATFSLNLVRGVTWDNIYNIVPQHASVYIADICNNDRDPSKSDEEFDGNKDAPHDEDSVKDDARQLEQQLLMLEELRTQQRTELERKRKAISDEDVLLNLSNTSDIQLVRDDSGNEMIYDSSFEDEELLRQYEHVQLPSASYNDTKYFVQGVDKDLTEVVVVIGSEVGISNAAKKFTFDNYGHKISIPLHNNVESLNTSVASGVVLYEILSQYETITKHFSDVHNNNDSLSV